jgi:hypothetical protein
MYTFHLLQVKKDKKSDKCVADDESDDLNQTDDCKIIVILMMIRHF